MRGPIHDVIRSVCPILSLMTAQQFLGIVKILVPTVSQGLSPFPPFVKGHCASLSSSRSLIGLFRAPVNSAQDPLADLPRPPPRAPLPRFSCTRVATSQVFSWDTMTNSPDTNETDGRSYISAVSEIVTDLSETCAGMAKTTMGEARMDIESSEIGYLGFQDSESYGLTWKVGWVVRQGLIHEPLFQHKGPPCSRFVTCQNTAVP